MAKIKYQDLRHSAAHLLASAVKELFPKVKLGIGPSIEHGFYYDFDIKTPFTEQDIEKIEKKMFEIVKKDFEFKKSKKTRKEAQKILKNEPYKLELLKDLPDNNITFYTHGNFTDLCLGPHIKSTGQLKAVKLLKFSGSYWKGDSQNKQLQRIYGVAFPSTKELRQYLKQLEEAEKRNHVKLGKQLDLFSIHPEGPGFTFWHPKGVIIYNEIIKYWEEEHKKVNYLQVKTPIILSKELWLKSGHWDHYKESMYFTKIDKRDFAIKPMNCPGGILIYKEKLHSYKEFPLRIAELGLVHRHELSGVLNGLFRVRVFTQDDAHIYCEENQIEQEVLNILELTERIYKKFNFKFHIELSTMPEKHIGQEKTWQKAEKHLENALKKKKVDYRINPGDGAFYGPKIDFHLEDALGRTWQCGTIQLDFSMPEKFNLTYDAENGKKQRPVMLHRTILGSMERFIGMLIEHYAGNFPLWLSPVQVRIVTVTDRNNKFAQQIYKKLTEKDIRVELDDRSESIGKKVREAQLMKIPLVITIGDKEQQKKTLAVRTVDGKVKFGVKIETFIKDIVKKISERK